MASQRSVSDWKVWGLIWALGAIGTLALVPYLLDLLGGPLGEQARKAGVSLSVIVAAQVVQSIVLLGVCSRIGIWAARRSGLTLPIFDALVARRPIAWDGRAALLTVIAGLVSGTLVVGLDAFVFAPASRLSGALKRARA